MNKKLILAGAAAVVGFISLTAFFDGKTREQQKAEIAQMITSKLDAYRMELTTACDARVDAEAQTRYAQVVAEREAEMAATTKGGKPVKKPTAKGNTVKPLPPATKPANDPTQDKKDKMQGTPNTDDKKDKMQQAPNTDKKKAKMQQQKENGGN